MPHVNRIVIGVNDEKKSAVIFRDSPNHQEVPGIFWRLTLWATTELPVNNQLAGDRAADVTAREPAENPQSHTSKNIMTICSSKRQLLQYASPTKGEV
ncbi:MAG: hypothetical protein WAK17_07185 [Candidatus Nitrosopolaris sp.]